jgi:hypothetical protein
LAIALTILAGTVQSEEQTNKRPDAEIPYPETVAADSHLPGVTVENWGYRLTQPGHPDNRLLVSATLLNSTTETRRGYLLAGLDHGKTAWADPSPAWYRAEIREVTLESNESKTVSFAFENVMNIHLGIKGGAYVPKLILYSADEMDKKEGAVAGVVLQSWNWAPVARRIPPWRVGFAGLLQNRNAEEKRVTLTARLKPKPDLKDYDGPPEGYSSDTEVTIPGRSFTRVYATSPDMDEMHAKKAFRLFDAQLSVADVKDATPGK